MRTLLSLWFWTYPWFLFVDSPTMFLLNLLGSPESFLLRKHVVFVVTRLMSTSKNPVDSPSPLCWSTNAWGKKNTYQQSNATVTTHSETHSKLHNTQAQHIWEAFKSACCAQNWPGMSTVNSNACMVGFRQIVPSVFGALVWAALMPLGCHFSWLLTSVESWAKRDTQATRFARCLEKS